MKVVYIAFSRIDDSIRGSQIQCRNTFEELRKINPKETFGIFLGDERFGLSKIRQKGNLFLIDMNSLFMKWCDRIFRTSIIKKILLPYLFIRKSAIIIKKLQPIDIAYVRVYSLSDAIFLMNNRKDLKTSCIVFELHDLDYDVSIYHHWLEKLIRKRQYSQLFSKLDGLYPAVKLVTVTNGLADIIKKRYDFGSPIKIIPNGHAYSAAKQIIIDYDKKQFKIVYAGLNFFKIKGIEYLIKALYYLDNRFAIQLIGGTETHRQLMAREFKYLIDMGRLAILPPMDHKNILPLLYDSDLAVLPLPKGNFSSHTSPLKMFEYMAIGLPIVASDVPAIREVLKDQFSAIFFEPENSRDLASKIEYLINNPKFAKGIALNAQEVSKQYTYQRRAIAILDIIKEESGV